MSGKELCGERFRGRIYILLQTKPFQLPDHLLLEPGLRIH